jgi:phosphate-selective porin OprO/OprP
MKRFLCACLVLASVVATADEKERLKVSGRALVDADHYQSFWSRDADNSNTNLEVRDARLQIEYDFPKGWEGKLQIDGTADSNGSDLDYGSVYMRYTKWKFADITLGRMKEPLGMERNINASKLITIERSMMTDAFTSNKSWGVHLFDANKSRRWALAAVVEDDQDNRYDEDAPMAISGRYTRSPINTEEQTLQLGASASLRDWQDNTFRIGSRAEVASADRVVRSAEFDADQQTTVALEGVFRHKSWQLEGEYMATQVEQVNGTDWDYSGYYISGSYFLTGEQRRFRKGEFRKLRPLTSSGAWELVARYSYLDVRDRGMGTKASVTTLGVNYYLGRKVKLMLDYLHADSSGSVYHNDPDDDAISARLQLTF